MATLANLLIKVKADTGPAVRGLKAVGTTSKTTAEQIKSIRAPLVAVAAGLAAFGFATKKIFDMGAAVGETASKFNTVFGPAIEDVNGFLGEFANMAGLSTREAQDLAGTTGALIQGFGFTRKESAALSKQVLQLAGDFASFNNLETAETARAVQAALTGERESLKRLGIVILETDVQKRALADTGKALAKELTQQDKALASLALIAERAGVQMGDLERTQDSAANQAKLLGAQFRDVADALAVSVQPAMAIFLGQLTDASAKSADLVEDLSAWSASLEVFASTIVLVARTASNSVQLLFGAVAATIVDMAAIAARAVEALIDLANLVPGIDLVSVVKSSDLLDFSDTIREGMKRDLADIGDAWTDLGTVINDVIRGLMGFDFEPPAVDGVTEDVRALIVDMSGLRDVSHLVSGGLVDTGVVGVQAFDGITASTRAANVELSNMQSKLGGIAGVLGSLGGIAGVLGGLGPLGELFSKGSGLFGSFSGLFAHGGTIPAGGFGIAGEAGPEIVTGPATVTPMSAAMAGGGDIVTHITLVAAGTDQAVSTITHKQKRGDNLRRVARVPINATVLV